MRTNGTMMVRFIIIWHSISALHLAAVNLY